MSKVLVAFDLKLHRAPRIIAFYLLDETTVNELKQRLEKDAARTFYLGELQGKHSETRFTGKQILSGLEIITNPDKIKAFSDLFDDKHVSYDLIDGLHESWVNDA